MLTLVKTISTKIDSTKRRLQKFLGLGLSDVKENFLIAPFGVDSHSVKDMVAVYGSTNELGKGVVIGYINKNAIAEIGGTRFYSTNANGAEQFYIYLRNTNNLELGGNVRHLARFEELEIAFNALKAEFNAHTHTGNLGYPTSPPIIPSVADISGAKINNIKVA
jgi:hypothetical protein